MCDMRLVDSEPFWRIDAHTEPAFNSSLFGLHQLGLNSHLTVV